MTSAGSRVWEPFLTGLLGLARELRLVALNHFASRRADELAVLHHHLAANHRGDRGATRPMAFERGLVVLAVQAACFDRVLDVQVDDRQVGVGADGDGALAREEVPAACRTVARRTNQ